MTCPAPSSITWRTNCIWNSPCGASMPGRGEHRTQIRTLLGFREATAADSDEMSAWLVEQVLATDQHPDHLRERVLTRFKTLKIEPPTADRLERLIRSASATFEQTFCLQASKHIGNVTRE